VQLFDGRIRAAEAKEAPAVLAAQPAAQQVPPPLQLAVAAPLKTQEELDAEQLQRAMAQLMWFGPYQQNEVVDVATLGAPTTVALPVFTKMFAWMTESVKGDQLLPYSFENMGCGSIEVAQGLVGDVVWNKTFPQDAALITDVCPYQLRMTIFGQLKAFSEHLKAPAKGHATAAKASLAAASAGWIKSKERASPYGA
jgi:hypothetical protein